MNNYRVPLSSDEKLMELSGFNVYDGEEAYDEKKDHTCVKCRVCGESFHPEEDDERELCPEHEGEEEGDA